MSASIEVVSSCSFIDFEPARQPSKLRGVHVFSSSLLPILWCTKKKAVSRCPTDAFGRWGLPWCSYSCLYALGTKDNLISVFQARWDTIKVSVGCFCALSLCLGIIYVVYRVQDNDKWHQRTIFWHHLDYFWHRESSRYHHKSAVSHII